MITKIVRNSGTTESKWLYDIRLLSTDEKPTDGVPNGSICIEIDTSIKYLFDAESQIWNPMVTGGTIENATKLNGHTADYFAKATDVISPAEEDGAYVITQTNDNMELADLDSALADSDEFQTKADVDGSYENLTAGNAEQLRSETGITDKVPYNFRQSVGNTDREYDEIVGGTIAWNQLIPVSTRSYVTYSGITVENNNDGTYTLNGTWDNSSFNCWITGVWAGTSEVFRFIKGHKYLCNGVVFYNDTEAKFTCTYLESTKILYSASEDTVITGIKTCNPQTASKTYSNYKYAPMAIDLTAAFGTAIADHLYALEQATPGAGVAKLKSWGYMKKDFYPYHAASLESVRVSSHVMTGFNQWDEVWESGGIDDTTGVNTPNSNAIRSKNYIPVFSGTTYYVKAPMTIGGYWYDADKNYIGRQSILKDITVVIPANVSFMRFGIGTGSNPITTYNHDICINISSDRNGEYEPYQKHEYPLDSSLTLRGIMKLDANNEPYFDGDTYAADGTVTRRYGIVDMGTLDWEYGASSVTGINRFRTTISDIKQNTSQSIPSLITDRYITTNSASYLDNDKQISSYSTYVYIRDDSYTDVATFKQAMSNQNVQLVYELATPTTETADPFRQLQIVDPYGTEAYTDAAYAAGDRDFELPVGHNTFYPTDQVRKLDGYPDDISFIAPIENGTKASQAYAQGAYFFHNKAFCKAKTAIASGATFTLGTNYEVTTVAAELYAAINS